MPDHGTKFSLGFALWGYFFFFSLSKILSHVYIQPFSYDCHGTFIRTLLQRHYTLQAEIFIRPEISPVLQLC